MTNSFMGRSRRIEPAPPTGQPYCIVDADGAYLGEIQAGDSFVGYDELMDKSSPAEEPS
jgi:hypothetical protein